MGLKQSDGHGWKDIEIMPTLRAERVFSVSGQTTSTSMPAKSQQLEQESTGHRTVDVRNSGYLRP